MDGVGREDAVHRGRGPESDGGIDIVDAELRRPRGQVRDARLHAYPISYLEVGDIGTDLNDHARGFVPEHHRRLNDIFPDTSMRVAMNVAATDAHRVDRDLHVGGSDIQGQVDFPKREFTFPFKDKSARL